MALGLDKGQDYFKVYAKELDFHEGTAGRNMDIRDNCAEVSDGNVEPFIINWRKKRSLL
jgi:hypothetical protein